MYAVNCSRTLAVIMPNIQGIRNDDWETYITTVDAVETLTVTICSLTCQMRLRTGRGRHQR